MNEGNIELRKRAVALETILKAAEGLVRATCAVNRQMLTVTLPAEPIYLEADAARLQQVFGNLLGNACKHGGAGCHITVSAIRDSGVEPPVVVVRVRDDGVGIDAELLPRIFDHDVQARLDRAPGGLGLCLTLVQRLVHMHGGTIEAASEGSGQGAEFIVRLPIMDAAFLGSASKPAAPSEISRRILIVDDHADSALSMAALQRRRGHEVRTAATGPEGLAAAAEFLPEVVLLDIGLPGMNGLEVARQLRATPAFSHTFLIAMTGYASPEDLRQAREVGFDEHLIKPVDLQLLRTWLADEARFSLQTGGPVS